MQRLLGKGSLVGEDVRAAGGGEIIEVGVGVGGGALDGVARVASVRRAQVARRGERDHYERRLEALGGTPAGARLQRRSPSLRSTQSSCGEFSYILVLGTYSYRPKAYTCINM